MASAPAAEAVSTPANTPAPADAPPEHTAPVPADTASDSAAEAIASDAQDAAEAPIDNAQDTDAPTTDTAQADGEATASDAQNAEEPAPPPLLPETAHAWLAQIKPAAVLALLREPDFAYVSMGAFAGYRVNASNYNLPLVRGRLAREAVKNDTLAEKLQALAEAVPPPPPAETPPAPPAAAPVPAPPPTPTDREQLRAERERAKTLRVERDGARLALADAQVAREQGAEAQRQAEFARADSERAAADAEREAGRLRRRVERLKEEVLQITGERDAANKRLRQALSEPRPALLAAGEIDKPQSTAAASAWREAAGNLLHRRRYDLALMLAEEVLRLDGANIDALDMAAQVYEARQEEANAAPFVRALLEQALTEARLPEAVDAWLRLVRMAPLSDMEKSLRLLLRALRPDDLAGVRQMRVALSRLQGLAPPLHLLVVEHITRLALPALAEALMPPPGALLPDDLLPLGLLRDVSARALLAAVDAGDDLLITQARDAWARLAPGSDDAERVRIALERAAGDDASPLQPLLRAPRGAVLVDASNVALHGQEMLARPRPRFAALQAMRRALLRRGWFPVFTIADANLPHHIDEPDALADLRARRAVRLVDSGTQADEALLREAKRLSAPLVTNDYMSDWDPDGTVTKIRYTFSHTGEVYFDQ